MIITRFPTVKAITKTELDITWNELVTLIEHPASHDSKADCPMLKLGKFGDMLTLKQSFRHDANLQFCSGIEADYDGEIVTPEAARDILAMYGIKGIIYTSPSHSPEKPRWRILADLSAPCPPEMRRVWLGKLNGIFGGILAPESFVLSQSYYYGRVNCAHIYHAYSVPGVEIDKLTISIEPIYPTIKTVFKEQPAPVNPVTDKTPECLTVLEAILRKAAKGERHYARLRVGKLAGGWIASGMLNEESAWETLQRVSDEIADGGKTSVLELQTLSDGISSGKDYPVYEIEGSLDLHSIKWDAPAIPLPPLLPVLNNHNTTLDTDFHYCKVDFLKYVDDNHLLKKLSLSIAKATDLPVHTIFIAGLSVFSSIAARSYKIKYQHNEDLPLGIYSILEQPSATGKSRVLSLFQRPLFEAEKEVKTALRLAAQEDPENLDIINHPTLKSYLITTNTTPEALDASLVHSGGYFSAVSSEQGLFNTLLGNCYGGDTVNNNDILLHGFDAGWYKGSRITRTAFIGTVIGSACMFAQQGSIENILNKSNGSGLAERFIFLAEKHNLGYRDFHKSFPIDYDLICQYNELCKKLTKDVLTTPLPYEALHTFTISAQGWYLINEYRNSIEKHMKDGGRYSHISIRGAAGKVNMQIMKIAANLQALDGYQEVVSERHIKAAISIAGELLEANLSLCTDKGIIGVRAEYNSILSLFENSNQPRTERSIIQVKSKTQPFKDFTGNKSELIRTVLTNMVNEGVLTVGTLPSNPQIKLYSVGQ